MITYRLTELLMFWDQMIDQDFDAIIASVMVIYDDEVPDRDKLNIIIAILKLHGLNTYTDGPGDIPAGDFHNTEPPIEVFLIHFMNGELNLWQNLN